MPIVKKRYLEYSASCKTCSKAFVIVRKRRDSVYSKMCCIFIGRQRLCFAFKGISPGPDYHKLFRTYFARTLRYKYYFTIVTPRCFCCCMICFSNKKMVSLLYDMSQFLQNFTLPRTCSNNRHPIQIFSLGTMQLLMILSQKGFRWTASLKALLQYVNRSITKNICQQLREYNYEKITSSL